MGDETVARGAKEAFLREALTMFKAADWTGWWVDSDRPGIVLEFFVDLSSGSDVVLQLRKWVWREPGVFVMLK